MSADITDAETEGDVREHIEENPSAVVKLMESPPGGRPVWFLQEDGSFTVVLEDGHRATPKGDGYEFGDHQVVVGEVDRDEVPDEPKPF